jgi:DNA-directed RNA polymerase subunit H (RpoH/RPB5)
MDESVLDLIVRSRSTILEILENRGYDVSPYKGVSPEEILKFATTSPDLLKIHGVINNDGGEAVKHVYVLYWVSSAVRLKLEAEMAKLWDEENPSHYNPENDELVIILSEPFNDAFHAQAIKEWTRRKARVSFFQLKNVITNPVKHTYVPPHRKLSEEEITDLMKGLHLKSKSELPHIKFHYDMQARVLGLVPGDIVEITRPSETSGVYRLYRVCTA